ncbi:type II toxin-antitoxin system RelE/ParE family toxin [Mannheimia sp. ZY171111]|uniref:type II toxin-antitoxin system RelE/ParE family toxin n=1 Tax=Mannheimia sp. ZY171111 TaxID=2679995 RepID=UPI001ADDA3F3|nr:type II toxin-antitoxin system RelE/ParE family toxin [Mannheimia sp. ZY171111]QTM01899.1 type II toxin-antitoxin system RelE/ParE family toxin [Mannheimia sp. ZY171111]
MANLILTPRARSNIDEILENVIEFTGYEQSGLKLYDDIVKKLELLAFMPTIGLVRDDGTRETFVRNYRIVYEIIEEDVFIITIIHTRRLYPSLSN